MPVQSNVRVCTHIKVTGVRCGSPALRGERFCYFHQRMVRGVRTPPNARLHPIALIENEEAIQASLMEVINALARNTIDLKRAALILRALNIAVKNASRVRFEHAVGRMVHEVPDYQAAHVATTSAPTTPEDSLSFPRSFTQLCEEEMAKLPKYPINPTQRKPPASVTEPQTLKERKTAAHSLP